MIPIPTFLFIAVVLQPIAKQELCRVLLPASRARRPGRAFNGYHWVFYGALYNVEDTITVTDMGDRPDEDRFQSPGPAREGRGHRGVLRGAPSR